MQTLLFLILSLSPIIGNAASKKSSEIPERREFPVDSKVNPCEDFYKYSCNKVIDSFELRPDRSRHTFAFADSAERLLQYKMDYFKNLSEAKPSSDREKQLKNFYLACMNEKARTKEEKDLVTKTLDELEDIENREQLLAFLEKRIVSTEPGAVGFDTINNFDNPLIQDLHIGVHYMSLPERSYYSNTEVTKDFTQLVTEFYKTVGIKNPKALALALLEFEKGFSEVYPLPQEFRELFTTRTKIERKEVLSKFANLRLDNFLERIPTSTLIRNMIPQALEYVNKELGSRDLQQLKAFFAYYWLSDYLDDAYPEYFKKKLAFANKHLGSAPQRPVRHERCTRAVMGQFTKEVDSILLPRKFPNFPEDKVVEVGNRIRASLLKSVEENKWLSKKSKKAAIQKIKTARLQMVAPKNDIEWDFNPVAEYSPNEPIKNGKLLGYLLMQKTLKEFTEPPSPDRWGMGPLTVNAYYSPSFNKFVLPAGILQYPFFDPTLSVEANLGGMGAVIGHELGHGIDDKGSRFDSEGKLAQWMTDADLKEFERRGQGLVEQFNTIGHNGKLTLGENIGDLVGVSSAYKAAFGMSPKKVPIKTRQEFFLQWGRVWCEVELPKSRDARLKTGPHSLGFARVNEQVKQQPGFKEAFQCKETDPMVLSKEKLVTIW